MDIFKFNPKNEDIKIEENSILLLGEFYFFHMGHYELFKKAKELQKNNERIGILIINNIDKNKKILTLENRLRALAKIGFDFVIVSEFNFEFKNLLGRDFIRKITKQYSICSYVVGSDFRFGKDRKSEAKDIINYANSSVDIIYLKKNNGIKISSSNIKQMYQFGELNLIKTLLVQPLEFDVLIKDNNKIIWPSYILKPHSGIYYGKILIDKFWYSGIFRFSINLKDVIFYLVNYDKEKIYNQETKFQLMDLKRIIINQRYDEIFEDDIDEMKIYYSI